MYLIIIKFIKKDKIIIIMIKKNEYTENSKNLSLILSKLSKINC